ncbi:MAG: dTDP-4-dehydrorhamnose 3,5-epimerase [Thermoanaerobaculia bacterium]|nr:dTDP-4-dehydrorhamnose 3,5-epimerase [Thermoanaerobaculia bacterium]
MIFEEVDLPGVRRIRPEPHEDERGLFARIFDRERFAEEGLVSDYPQHSLSFNRERGTLRGMHWQAPPYGETKLVRCVSGRLWDVVVDLRPESPTYLDSIGIELSAANRESLYVPEGFAHGFLTLVSGTEILYLISEPYRPEAARGARWNDPAFEIEWPHEPRVISDRDDAFPDFQP